MTVNSVPIEREISLISDISPTNYPIVIFDTNVLLDYAESRSKEVKNYINKKLLPLQRKNLITLGTTLYNLAELLDKEFEINLQLNFIKKKITPDEIIKKVKDRKGLFNYLQKFEDGFERTVKVCVNKKVWNIINKLSIFCLHNFAEEDCELLEELIVEGKLMSQDSMIVLTIFKFGNYTYFLTKDDGIINSPSANNYIQIYDMKNEDHRKELLEALKDDIDYLGGVR